MSVCVVGCCWLLLIVVVCVCVCLLVVLCGACYLFFVVDHWLSVRNLSVLAVAVHNSYCC